MGGGGGEPSSVHNLNILLSEREGTIVKGRGDWIICIAAAGEPASSRPTEKKFSKLFDETRSKDLANICENSHFWGCRRTGGGWG